MEPLPTTDRSTLRRHRERGSYDRELIYAILDEALVCHVGFLDGDVVVVVPSTYARMGDRLYLHGAVANAMLRRLASGVSACLTVTLLDGLVFSRAAFHHSMNYRSVMLFGAGMRIDDETHKREAVLAIVEHMAAGRSNETRPPTAKELKSTSVVAFPIDEGSAKVRIGGPIEEPEDLALPFWAGQLPLATTAMAPVPDPDLPEHVALPPYVRHYERSRAHPRPDDAPGSRGKDHPPR